MSSPAYREIELERHWIAIRRHIPEATLRDIEIRSYMDNVLGEMAVELRWRLLAREEVEGQRQINTETSEYVPASFRDYLWRWVQDFAFIPWWISEFLPRPRMRRIPVFTVSTTRVYRVCPHGALPANDANHFYWMGLDDDAKPIYNREHYERTVSPSSSGRSGQRREDPGLHPEDAPSLGEEDHPTTEVQQGPGEGPPPEPVDPEPMA